MVALGGLDCSPFSHSCPLPLPAHLLTPPPPPFPPLAQSNSNKRSRADGTNQIKDAASKWGAEFEALEEDDQFTYLDTLASLMGYFPHPPPPTRLSSSLPRTSSAT